VNEVEPDDLVARRLGRLGEVRAMNPAAPVTAKRMGGA